ncbi:aldose 1-epimerase [Actinobacillus equuli]|nr:aldose 1-epimerase [Actinobacillus equuli]
MPALQCYSGNWLGGQPDLNGSTYQDYAGVALEPEFFPDSPNQAELANSVALPKRANAINTIFVIPFTFNL